MTIITTGAYDFPAEADRNRTSMMLETGASPLEVVDGVHSGLALTKTTGMGFAIGPGRAAVNGNTPADGTFAATILSDEQGAFEPGDATRHRVDLIVLQTYPQNPFDTGVKVEVVKGDYPQSGSPVAPTTPPGALPLFEVPINAGVSSGNGGWDTTKVIDRRQRIGVPKFIDYTPNWAGMDSIGTNARRIGRYRLDGDKCSVNVRLTGGEGASMGVAQLIAFTLPIPAAGGYLYYGGGAVHHPNATGTAYDLRVVSSNTQALIFAMTDQGALRGPGQNGYPFGPGTEIFANLEYIIAT